MGCHGWVLCVHVNRKETKEIKAVLELQECQVYQEHQYVSHWIIYLNHLSRNSDHQHWSQHSSQCNKMYCCFSDVISILAEQQMSVCCTRMINKNNEILSFLCSTGQSRHWWKKGPARERCEEHFHLTSVAFCCVTPAGLVLRLSISFDIFS